jgi:hypothetical protein
MKWICWPTSAAIVEKMEDRGLKVVYDYHAVNLDATPKRTLCGVKMDSLVDDSSQFTKELPDCPRCKDKILRAQATEAKRLMESKPAHSFSIVMPGANKPTEAK